MIKQGFSSRDLDSFNNTPAYLLLSVKWSVVYRKGLKVRALIPNPGVHTIKKQVAKWCGIYVSTQKEDLSEEEHSECIATKESLLPPAVPSPMGVSVGAAGLSSALPVSCTGHLHLHICCCCMAGAYPRFPSFGVQSSWD